MTNPAALGLALRGAFSRPAMLLLGALAGAVAFGVWSRGCGPDPVRPEVGAPESTRTEPAKDARKWQEEETAPPPRVRVLRPAAADRSRVARAIDRPDLLRELTPETIEAERQLGIITQEQADAALASYRAEQERLAKENRALKERLVQFEREITARRAIPPSPWGGTATATLDRIQGKTDLDYERKPRPRVNLLLDFGVGARYRWSDAEISGLATATPTTETASAYLFAEPVEFGRRFPTVLRLDVGYERVWLGDVEADGWYGAVAFETHFNRDRRVERRTSQEE